MDYEFQFRKLGRDKARRWLFVVGLVAVTHLLFQSLLLPYGKALRSMLPENEVTKEVEYDDVKAIDSSTTSVTVRNTLMVNASDLIDTSVTAVLEEDDESFNVEEELESDTTMVVNENDRFEDISLALQANGQDSFFDKDLTSENDTDVSDIVTLTDVKSEESDTIVLKTGNNQQSFTLEQIPGPNMEITEENVSLISGISDGGSHTHLQQSKPAWPEGTLPNATLLTALKSRASISLSSVSQHGGLVISATNSSVATTPGPKKMRCDMPPKSITTYEEMNRILVRHRAKSRAMRPLWSSPRDQEILAARALIEHPPVVKSDKELYAPIFRNISMFKRSYELMERTLKVYVYKEGEKPIFHQPILKGLYASEGWFMKLMEGNKQFAVKDPQRAHLFYMPFSSRMLEFTLYVRNSHNRTNLRQYLKHYSEKIAAKYRYWNRTDGADHFLVACHDWAPYETRHHMERCIKALCNADVTAGFKIGRDVSLPETYVRSARNPLRDLGGKPPSQRNVLAFYAGNLHGYLRPILLKHWKDKDPDMKILGPMPPGVATKMSYIGHMKSSKYCICPKGYEVNSPRVVEAIFYECVPVIISDNFVPPFFEVLDWDAFSVVIAEKDVPRLKDVLLSIPEERYLAMQTAVRRAQRHFLWHAKPVKYDLFHMTLHSIWYNRVFQIKPR